MPRMAKSYIKGAVLFITSRGDNNEEIFKDKEDYDTYIRLLAKYKQQYNFNVFAYCLVPTFLHLLIELKEGLLISNILHDIHSAYTRYFNSKYLKKGHVFQERYRMSIIEKEGNLLLLINYAHLVPKRIALSKGLDHPYSSYAVYSTKGANMPVDMKPELEEVGIKLGKQEYPQYLSGAAETELENLDRELQKKNIIGSADFIQRVRESAESYEQAKGLSSNKPAYPVLIIWVAAGGIALLAGLSAYLFYSHALTKNAIQKELDNKDMELSKKLAQEREFIKKDLNEKYQADLVSFQAMSKRLEIEKKKSQELEKKVNQDKK